MAKVTLLIALFCQLLLLSTCADVNIGKIEKQILDAILSPTNYDKRIRPRSNSTDNATNVTVTSHILAITDINEDKQSFGMDMYFRQSWRDDRLKFDDANRRIKYLTLTNIDTLWTPDLFFTNDYKGFLHELTVPNVFARIYSNGTVFMSKRFQVSFRARLDYDKFPFDSQNLQVRIESYGYTASEMQLIWGGDVSISDTVDVTLFSVGEVETESGSVRVNTGEYTFLELHIPVSRLFNYYLIHIFIPCQMCVVVAYLTFWLDIKFITARIVLGTTTLYTMATCISMFNSTLPNSTNTRYIDVYTGVTLTFVFAALMEIAFAHSCDTDGKNPNIAEQENPEKFSVKNLTKWLKNTRVNKVDAICRILYPCSYICFAIIYGIVALV